MALWLSKADPFTSGAGFVDKLDAGAFERLSNGGFIRSRDWNFSVEHLNPADRRYSDF
jgi:hypothetical protein